MAKMNKLLFAAIFLIALVALGGIASAQLTFTIIVSRGMDIIRAFRH